MVLLAAYNLKCIWSLCAKVVTFLCYFQSPFHVVSGLCEDSEWLGPNPGPGVWLHTFSCVTALKLLCIICFLMWKVGIITLAISWTGWPRVSSSVSGLVRIQVQRAAPNTGVSHRPLLLDATSWGLGTPQRTVPFSWCKLIQGLACQGSAMPYHHVWGHLACLPRTFTLQYYSNTTLFGLQLKKYHKEVPCKYLRMSLQVPSGHEIEAP